MKNRIWIIIFAVVAAVCLLSLIFIKNAVPATRVAEIYQNGKIVKRIDLNTVTAEQEITLSGDSGENIISISNGHIKMKSAQCPDKLCVKHGELKNGGTPIVCLPNKIVIKFADSGDTDAKTGAVQ